MCDDDKQQPFKTVVRYLDSRRARYWDTKQEACDAVSRFQLSCHDLAIRYSAEVWEVKPSGNVLIDQVEELPNDERIIIALTRERCA
jgi:hypothetical protein